MSGYHFYWDGIGWPEVAIVLVMVFIFFGHHLPGIMRSLFRPPGPW